MIHTKEVNIRINHTNIEYYKNIGYDIKTSDIIVVPVEHLSKGSKAIIEVSCDDCGKKKKYDFVTYMRFVNKNKYHKYLCRECGMKLRDENNIEKYGVKSPMQREEIVEKKRKTSLEKYGFDHPCKSESVKNKIFDTNFERYGVKCPSQNKIIQEKIQKTNIKKYGGISSFCSKEIRNKSEQTMFKKYGFEFSNQIKDFHDQIIEHGLKTRIDKIKNKYSNIQKIIGTTYTVKCDNGCEHNFEIDSINFYQRIRYNTIICTVCNPIDKLSSGKEIEFIKFITDNYSGETIKNSRILDGKEIDIFLPELEIGFEFNGLYWHSDEFKDNNYHKNKIDLAKLMKIKLFHIYEDGWIYKKNIIKNDILRLLRLSKEVINIFECDNELSNLYVSKTNLHGYGKSNINISASNSDNEIVSMMSIKRMKNNYEIVRLTGDDYFDELFKYFIDNYKPKTIFGSVNKDWDIYDFYERNNFIMESETEPNYQYLLKGNHRVSEIDILLEKQIPKIFDSGKINYKINI